MAKPGPDDQTVVLTSIRFSSAKPRPKPEEGQRKVIKGVDHVRVMSRANENGRVVGFNCTGGRQNYEWMPLDKAIANGFYRLPQVVPDLTKEHS